jgi:hypothetical protein
MILTKPIRSSSMTTHLISPTPDPRTNAVLQRVTQHDGRRRAVAHGPLPDMHLCELQMRLGRLAEVISSHAPAKGPALRGRLEEIAGYGIGWLETLGERDISELLLNERARQRQLFREHRLPVQCESPVIDPLRKLRFAVEKCGEVAAAIDLLEGAIVQEIPLRLEEFQARLGEFVAISVAWLESLEAATPKA